jgi:hypothetical protein
MGTGEWLVRAGLPILWLILNDIYKPAPTDWGLKMNLFLIPIPNTQYLIPDTR